MTTEAQLAADITIAVEDGDREELIRLGLAFVEALVNRGSIGIENTRATREDIEEWADMLMDIER